MNNRGQVLVVFILLIPVILALCALIIDLGLFMTKTYKIKQSMKEAITYELNTGDSEGTRHLLNKNIGNDYEITIGNTVVVRVKGSFKSILGSVINKNIYKYDFRYVGYKIYDEVIIKEE